MQKHGHILLALLLTASGPALAGGADSDKSTAAESTASTSQSTATTTDTASDTSAASSASTTTTSNSADTTAQATTSEATTSQASTTQAAERTPTGFRAIEDEQLEIDTSTISDGDGLGSIQIQWQISDNGDEWRVMPGAITPNFIPRDAHVGRFLRVVVSYIDGQGNSEQLISPMSQAVENVNDTPVGQPEITGDARENSLLRVDTSRVSDEDGIGALAIAWERSTTKTEWQAAPELLGDTLALDQSDVGFSYRATVTYTDGFGTREVLTTEPTEIVANVDNPLQGDVVLRGVPTEGNEMVASTSSLTDYDGIASMALFWESSADGRTWDTLDYANGQVQLMLDQSLVGLKLRSRVEVVDTFGVETVVTSKPTEAVRNVNNKPAGQLLIRRVGS